MALQIASPARASFEPIKVFAESGEEGLNDGPGALAVNEKTGDVYEADGERRRVLRFDFEGHFREAWGWGVGDGKAEFERCGPEGEPAQPVCNGFFDHSGVSGEGPGQFAAAEAIAVDQTTGNVYVTSARQSGIIQEFTSEGEFITSFGVKGSASPAQIQFSIGVNNIAVDPAGNVYLIDQGETHGSKEGARVMVFEPKALGEYAYSHDLFAGSFATSARALAIDSSGALYLAKENQIYKFDQSNLATPAWELSTPQFEAMTVDPSTGRLFYYTFQGNEFHSFRPRGHDEIENEHGEVGKEDRFKSAGIHEGVVGAAFSPNVSFTGHPAGVFYADIGFSVHTQQSARALIFAPQSVFPPAVDAEAVSSVGATNATLEAQINAKGFDTHYRFEYGNAGPCSANACAEAPLGGADLGSANEDRSVSVSLGGLVSDTTYYYRVLATNAFGAAEGADGSFHTFPATASGLPDQRAYELVSPPDKHGGEVFPLDAQIGSCKSCEPGENNSGTPRESAPGGEAVVYEGYPFSASGGAVGENEYLSVRSASGWQTRDLSSPREGRESKGFRAFSSDLARGVFGHLEPPLVPEAPSGYEDLYLQQADGTLQPLLIASPPHRARYQENQENAFDLEFAGASADFTHVVFTANDALTPATADAPEAPEVKVSENNLYEWTGGELRLVNVLPSNLATAPGADFGSGDELKSTTEAAPDYNHAVSADGSRIFWTDLKTGQLYVRENGKTTREVPDSHCQGSLPPNARICFLTANANGTKILLSDGHLRDLNIETVVDLTKGQAGFEGILGSSEDLSRVYFVDTAVLTEEENDQKALAKAGADNLYLYDAGSESLRFIATLLPADNQSLVNGIAGAWKVAPSDRLAQVTPDGSYLAFMSHAPLTGYDNRVVSGKCREGFIDESFTSACFEVFEYDATSGGLVCASCNPTSLPPTGGSRLSLISPTGSRLPQPRSLTDDGRLFFDSFDALSPHDQRPGVENVYEYEREGQGSCTRQAGCILLISSGHSSFDSSFLSASASGRDVFFTTREQLLPEDQDELVDLYDAREGGGFPPTIPLAPCSGEGCRPAPSLAPVFPAAASSSFSGPGNLAPPTPPSPAKPKAKKKTPKCAKGKTRKHRKCVKVKHRKTSKAKKGSAKHKQARR